LRRRWGRDRRSEMRVHDVDGVELAVGESRHEVIDQAGGVLRGRPISDVDSTRGHRASHISIIAQTLFTDGVQLDFDAIALQLCDEMSTLADEIGVERAREATVSRDEHD